MEHKNYNYTGQGGSLQSLSHPILCMLLSIYTFNISCDNNITIYYQRLYLSLKFYMNRNRPFYFIKITNNTLILSY